MADSMRGRPPSPEKREAILAAAGKLFSAEGFDRVTTRQIAELAGTTERTLFKHFGSKVRLFQAVIEQVSLQSLARHAYARIHEPEPFSREEFAGWHRAFLRDRVAAAKAAPDSYGIIFRELLRDADFRKGYAARWMSEVFAPLTTHLESMQRRRQFAGGQSPAALASAFFSLNLGFLLSRFVLLPDFPWDDERQIETVVELFGATCNGENPPSDAVSQTLPSPH
ncbi:MAG TPA: TetR/AcrR family transcriptional regulator [Devosia sp.]|nr:TetR/AcrR family transcriptional regulator [Devosia sp.]